MKELEGLQAIGTQTLTTAIDNGDSITITLVFKPAIKMWFMDIEYEEFILKGVRLCNVPNLLQQYDKIIPFGINITVSDNTEPYIINDLSSGRVIIGILTPEEVNQINASYEEAKI